MCVVCVSVNVCMCVSCVYAVWIYVCMCAVLCGCMFACVCMCIYVCVLTYILTGRLWQIIASGSTAYDIPWPSGFMSFLDSLRVFLVDVISLTRANCAQPMSYYDSLVVVLVGFKIVLFDSGSPLQVRGVS